MSGLASVEIEAKKKDVNLNVSFSDKNGNEIYGQAGVEMQKNFKDLSKSISDGIILNRYNELLEIRKAINSHEANMLQVNPKIQTKNIDTFPEMHRFLIGLMTKEELILLKEKILQAKNSELRKEIRAVFDKYYNYKKGENPINLELLPPISLIELKELCYK